jgi:hypothetical protein
MLVSIFAAFICTAAAAADDTGTEAFLTKAPDRVATSPGSATGTCLAATSASVLFHDAAVRATKAAADIVLADFSRTPAGHQGLGLPPSNTRAQCAGAGTGSFFRDGTCNSADTRYALETARGISCLARATLLTGDKRYADAGVRAMTYWQKIGGKPPGCADCFYFWYDDAPYHANRYVRNTNVEMGAAAAWLWKATSQGWLRDLALGVAQSERVEAQQGNNGYYSVFDPRLRADPEREKQRIENHGPLVASGLMEIAGILKQPDIGTLGLNVYRTWLTCGGTSACNALPCERWAGRLGECTVSQVMTPCFFRKMDASAQTACTKVEAALPTLNSFQIYARYDADFIDR